MASAKDNEKIFVELFERKVRGVQLHPEKKYEITDVEGRKLSSSVDHYFEYDGRQVLIEIDSYNMAKVVVGQYVLLNKFRDESLSNPLFLIIHTYNNYRITRTIKYLEYLKNNVLGEDSIPFGVMHMNTFRIWSGGDVDQFISLFNT